MVNTCICIQTYALQLLNFGQPYSIICLHFLVTHVEIITFTHSIKVGTVPEPEEINNISKNDTHVG